MRKRIEELKVGLCERPFLFAVLLSFFLLLSFRINVNWPYNLHRASADIMGERTVTMASDLHLFLLFIQY